jgi:hypothetical protein
MNVSMKLGHQTVIARMKICLLQVRTSYVQSILLSSVGCELSDRYYLANSQDNLIRLL